MTRKEKIKAIQQRYRDDVAAAEKRARTELAKFGYVEGNLARGYGGKVYEITRITFDAIPGWMYGRQLRRDNTYGTAQHNIGDPSAEYIQVQG